MKTIRLYSLLIILFSFLGCSEDTMDNINKNPNNPLQVDSKFVLTDVMTSTAFNITGADYAFYSSIYMELNAGIFGQMYNAEVRAGEPSDPSTYNNTWNSQYRCLYQLKLVMDRCTSGVEKGNSLNLAIAQVLYAYNLAMLTDLMGDIPLTEALQPGVIYQPKLDKQESVYGVVVGMLDQAILNVDKSSDFDNLGGQDLIYGGDGAKWKKAAYALKARYAMRLSLRTPNYAKVIEYADKSFASAAEEFKYNYTGANSVNPFSRFLQDRNYLGASLSLSQKLVSRADPRMSKFFKPAPGQSVVNFAPNGNPQQRQKYYGYSALTAAAAPTYLVGYHELCFLKAEAYIRATPSQTASAETELIKGIKAAFVKVGLTESDAVNYYNANVKPLFVANPLQEIMIQKYLAFYQEEGVEAFNDYRRLKAMGNNVISLANTNQFPLRFTYGTSDYTTNPNVRDATGDGTYVYKENVWWAGGTR